MPYTPMNQRKNYDAFGRIGLGDPVPDDEIRNFRNPTKLSEAVGATGRNQRRDVAKVEKLLGSAGTLDLKKTDGPTGYWGMRTDDATRRFQEKEGLKVDGEIKPNGPTIRKLADKRDAAKRRKERRERNRQRATDRDNPYVDYIRDGLHQKIEDEAKKRAADELTRERQRKEEIEKRNEPKTPDRSFRGGGGVIKPRRPGGLGPHDFDDLLDL